MNREIERKFLTINDSWRQYTERKFLCHQGYIPTQNHTAVRVRIIDNQAFITLKGPVSGISRDEFEYEIPLQDAETMMEHLCVKPFIEKHRYWVRVGSHLWEIDEFLGDNDGLIVAEIELTSENEPFERPSWLGQEVSGIPDYYNSRLAVNPYKNWKKS